MIDYSAHVIVANQDVLERTVICFVRLNPAEGSNFTMEVLLDELSVSYR